MRKCMGKESGLFLLLLTLPFSAWGQRSLVDPLDEVLELRQQVKEIVAQDNEDSTEVHSITQQGDDDVNQLALVNESACHLSSDTSTEQENTPQPNLTTEENELAVIAEIGEAYEEMEVLDTGEKYWVWELNTNYRKMSGENNNQDARYDYEEYYYGSKSLDLWFKVKANPTNWKRIFLRELPNLSRDEVVKFADIVGLASIAGEQFSDDYNFEIYAEGGGDDLDMQALLESHNNGIWNHDGGVCRHVAKAQNEIFKLAGYKSYMVGYASQSGPHVNTIVIDPNDPNHVVKLNYGTVTESKGQGAGVLGQDHAQMDVGIAMRVYDWQGKPVGLLPSEMGSMLREVTGANYLNNPLEKKGYSLTTLGGSFKESFDPLSHIRRDFSAESTGTGIKGFYGQTSTGRNVAGLAALYVSEDRGGLSRSEFAAAGALINGENAQQEYAGGILYLRGARTEAITKNIGETTRVGAAGTASLELNGTYTESDYEIESPWGTHSFSGEDFSADGNLQAYAHVWMEQDLTERDLLRLDARTSWYLGLDNALEVSVGADNITEILTNGELEFNQNQTTLAGTWAREESHSLTAGYQFNGLGDMAFAAARFGSADQDEGFGMGYTYSMEKESLTTAMYGEQALDINYALRPNEQCRFQFGFSCDPGDIENNRFTFGFSFGN